MNLEKVNHWLTLLANVGVLVGIVFLVIEVRQNTEAIYGQSRQAIYAGVQEELFKFMEYPELFPLMASNEEELTLEQIGKVLNLTHERVRQLEAEGMRRLRVLLRGVDNNGF